MMKMPDKPKRKSHWTFSRTPEREQLMKELREMLDETRPDSGERIHGQLTDAQIFVWGLLELQAALKKTKDPEPPTMFQTEYRHR